MRRGENHAAEEPRRSTRRFREAPARERDPDVRQKVLLTDDRPEQLRFYERLGFANTRTLRQTAGITAAEILTGRTLHEARGMLQDGSLPIGLISEMLGFSSAAYFTRFIQKHTGKTPTALRRRR